MRQCGPSKIHTLNFILQFEFGEFFKSKNFFIFSTHLLLPTHLPPPSCTHAQSCDPMHYSLPGSSVHGLFQTRILEWVAISFSKTYFTPHDRGSESVTQPSWLIRLHGIQILGMIFKTGRRTFLVGKWIRLHDPKAGSWDSVPGQGTISYILQLRVCLLQLKKIPHATTGIVEEPVCCN